MKGLYLCILSIFFFLFIVNNVNATLGNFPINSSVNIVAPLNATSVTLTNIIYPNGSIALTNQAMSSSGSLFTYAFSSTSSIGIYTYGFCDNLGNCYSNDFTISRLGYDLSNSQGSIYIIFCLVMIFIFIFTLYFAITIPWKHKTDGEGKVIEVSKLRFLKLFFFPMAYIELMWIFAILYHLTFNFLSVDTVSPIFYWLYSIMLALWLPIVTIFLIAALILFFQDKKLKDKIFRGYRR